MLVRLTISLLGGVLAAGALLWSMQWLVLRDSQVLQQPEARPVMEFVRLKRDSETRLRERERPEEPPPPEEAPPPIPPMLEMEVAKPVVQTPKIDFALPNIPFSADGPYIGPVRQGPPDRDFIAISRLPPQYPYRAVRAGIEGWVRVSFLVTEQGEVQDVVVVESKPKGIFDHAAIRAVMKWRFKPRIQDGKAVSARAEQTVNFRLNDKH